VIREPPAIDLPPFGPSAGLRPDLKHLAARDLREGGRWSVLQRLKNDGIHALAAASLAAFPRLPPSLLRALGRGLGWLVWASAHRLRRAAAQNIAHAFPDLAAAERARFVRRVYLGLGGLLGDTVAALHAKRQPPPLPFLPGSRAVLEDALAEGRGVVFASAHLGPWEEVAASLVAAGFPLTVVAREPYDPRFATLYARLRERRGVRTIYRGAAGAGIGLVRVLRRGELLGVPMDLASRVTSIEAPFLGRPARTAVGPARLAIRTGAVVVVGTAAPMPGTSRLGLSFCRIESSTDEHELTRRINVALGDRIRRLPELWPWMHDRWRTAERGSDAASI
jgi:Kdo2-lipid IVA lauroyltransferase/acyltransferase